MSLAWIGYVFFCIVGAAAYNISMKVAGDHINPFVFTVGLTATALVGHLACLLFYKFHMGENVSWQADRTGIQMALLAGAAVVVIDLCVFFAIKTGGVVATNILFTVGAMLLTTLVGFFLFKEPLTPTKIAGLALGAVSLIMIAKG
jgi:drug/metabolite transporter (DMT)-like permease